MEELYQSQIFMVKEILDEKFNEKQWLIIKRQSPINFLQFQQMILNKLLSQRELFMKFFQNFYANHAKLFKWSMLATQRKAEISAYVFKNLLNRGSSFFNNKIKGELTSKLKKKYQERSQLSTKEVKNMQEQVYKEFFFNMVGRNGKENSVSSKAYSRNKEVENMDGHDFYIRTFNACNGWKYIFYNYEKHMKGLSEKWKYNEKIRSNQQKNFIEEKGSNQLGLLEYQHKISGKSPEKVYYLNEVVKNPSINTFRGFKSLVKDSSCKKLIFQNHQGKPITYRVSRN